MAAGVPANCRAVMLPREDMKALLWTGLGVLVLGVVSVCAPVLRDGRDSVKVVGPSAGGEVRHSELVPVLAGGVMILAGAGLMFAGKKRA